MTMREMAWERARGELLSMLRTYYGEHGEHEMYTNMREAVEKAIALVEEQL